MTWIRIGLEYLHKKGAFTKLNCLKCEPIIFYVPLGCIFILELFILGNIENKYS